MKKALPVLIAIVLILIIGGGYGAKIIHDKYSYSKETMDSAEYFGLTDDDEAAVVLQNERADFYAKIIDGYCYFDLDTTLQYFNDHFYYDEAEGKLIYVEPLQITTATVGESGYDVDGASQSTQYVPACAEDGTLYVACDYIKKFTNYSYEFFEEPGRMQVYTQWDSKNIAYIKKDTQIRYRGGVKSDILKEVKKGDKVEILEEYEDWDCVKTDDCYIGYVEKKRLENYDTEEPIPVTDYTEPEFTSQTRDYKINMAWHNIAGVSGNDTLASMIANTHDINVISPTWFGIADNNGGISDYGSADYVATAHSMGMEVWALVSNFVSTDIDTYEVLSKTSTRTALINNLTAAALKYGVDGINVDFEDLSTETGKPFVEFIRELSVQCRKNQLVLSVDNYVPIGNTDYYNRKEQGIYADYVVIMGYDEHYKGSSEAGSVASIDYVEKGIQKTISEVPASKVINGVPFYTRIWETTGAAVDSQAVGMETANEWITEHGLTPTWDDTACQNYAEYTSGETKYQVWLEDAESIAVKLNVMDANGLAGVASWCLGFETSDVWDTIAEYLNK